MYRYYLVHDSSMPLLEENYGHWSTIHLCSHGPSSEEWNVLVLHDRHVQPHEDWIAFPRVVDSRTPIRDKVPHHVLADIGLTGDETTLEAVDTLAAIFPAFEHP